MKSETLLQIHEDKMKSETLKNPPGDADLRVWHLSNQKRVARPGSNI